MPTVESYSVAHAGKRLLPEGGRLIAVLPELEETVGQRVDVIDRHQHPAACLLHHFGERATSRLYHRHTAGHRFEQKHAFGLVVRRRHRQHVETTKKAQFAIAIELRHS